jgi:hypothetical protein
MFVASLHAAFAPDLYNCRKPANHVLSVLRRHHREHSNTLAPAVSMAIRDRENEKENKKKPEEMSLTTSPTCVI